MASFRYLLYRTDLGNTIINESATPFTPGPNEAQIFTNFEIPVIQPLYLYAESGGNVIANTDSNINSYLASVGALPFEYLFTGYTASTEQRLDALEADVASLMSGSTGYVTNTKFNTYTGTTAPATYQTKSSIATLTGTTLPQTYQTKASIVVLTGTTLPNTYADKAKFLEYTGTTAPATYATKVEFNPVSALTFVNKEILDLTLNGGQLSGGQITPTGGVNFSISSGTGLARDMFDKIVKVSWGTLTGSTTSGGDNFVSVNASGQIVITSTWGSADNVRLGYIRTNGANNIVIGYSSLSSTLTNANYNLANWLRSTIGVLVEDGLGISMQTNPLKIVRSSGSLWAQFNKIDIPDASAFTKTYIVSGGTGLIYNNNPNQLDNQVWNDVNGVGLAALVTMTNTYWKKDMIFVTPEGQMFYAFGKAEYATQEEAEDSPLPTIPDSIKNSVARLASFVIQKGAASATTVFDIRPIFSRIFGGSVANAPLNVIDHGDLAGLLDDDHPQYLTDVRGDARYQNQIDLRLLTSTFNFYTGTTAPATYQTKSSIAVLTGTTLPQTYQSKSSIVTLTGTTLPATYADKGAFFQFTGVTAPATYQTKASINVLTGTTLPATYQTISTFNNYTGNTLPVAYVPRSLFNSYTGNSLTSNITSAINGVNKSGTAVRLGGLLTGATSITAPTSAARLSFGGFPVQYNGDYSVNYNIRSLVDVGYATGLTSGFQTKLNILTGTTLPLTYQSKASIVVLTGTTLPLTYVSKSVFSVFTGNTAIQSANNGLSKSGTNVKLGGDLTGATTINSPGTTARLTFGSFPVQYAGPYSANYNSRSLVDMGYVTGLTSTLGTSASNGLTKNAAGNIHLGGSLTGATTVNALTFALTNSGTTGQLNMIRTTGSINLRSRNQVNLVGVSAAGANTTTFKVSATGVTFTDGRGTPVGIQYAAPYSANYTTRSLTDMGYVTGLTSAINTRINIYTGTTAPLTYQSKASIVVLTGTTLPQTYQSKTSIVTLTGTTLPNTYAAKSAFLLYTGTTAPLTYQSKASIVTLTGTTLPNTYAGKAAFLLYTGTTAPATYQSKASIVVLTGTTLPLTYQSKASIVTLTGTTLPNTYAAKSAFLLYTGTTAPLTYQSKASIVTLTGTTLPQTYQSKASIVVLTGTTLPQTYQSKASIVTLTGTTLPNTYQSKTSIVVLTGTTLPATYVAKTLFNTFTGNTISTASNGLIKSTNTNVKLGGNLIGATTITSTGTTSRLSFAGFPLQYATDLTSNYNTRSLIDRGHFTGNTLYTSKEIIVFASGATNINVTTPLTVPWNRLIKNDNSFFTYTGGTGGAIKILTAGTYDISYQLALTNSNGTEHSVAASIYKNGVVVTETTSAASLIGVTSSGAQLVLPPVQLTLAANDIIHVRGYRLVAGGGNVTTVANSTFLKIVKKY